MKAMIIKVTGQRPSELELVKHTGNISAMAINNKGEAYRFNFNAVYKKGKNYYVRVMTELNTQSTVNNVVGGMVLLSEGRIL